MKQSNRLRKGLYALIALIALLGFSGCTWSEDKYTDPTTGNNVSNKVTITVNIPGMQTPTTRSIEGEKGEAVVKSIDILVFEQGASYGAPDVLVEHVQGMDFTYNGNQVKFVAPLSLNSRATNMMLVANATTETEDAVFAAGGIGMAKKPDILSQLTYASSNLMGTPEGWKWEANINNFQNPVAGMDYTPIPMYGESPLPSGGIAFGMNINDIWLTRMLARIDVVNYAPTDFELLNVYVVNFNTAGYIAPAWNIDGEMLPILPENMTIPSLSGSSAQLGFNLSMRYDYELINGGNGLFGEIYTYEAKATTGVEGSSGHTDAVCLILRGKYLGNTYYYRVDFTAENPNLDPLSVDYMPLLRNNRYTVQIVAARGIGYDTPDEAIRSLGIMNNLKTELLVVDESQITNIVFNGQSYLGTGDDVMLTSYVNQKVNVLCSTNYTYGWELDNSMGTNGIDYTLGEWGWLSAEKDLVGGSVKTADLILTTLRDNFTSADWEAYVHLKAGRLRHSLKVTMTRSICGKDGVPVAQPIGENSYLTHMFGNKCWMIENSVEGTGMGIAYGLDWDGNQCGGYVYGNLGDLNGYYYTWEQANQTNNACPAGWRLPTEAEVDDLTDDIYTYFDGGSFNGISKWWCGWEPEYKANAGCRFNDVNWRDWGYHGYWWFSTRDMYFWNLYWTEFKAIKKDERPEETMWNSVRCVRYFIP